MIKYKTGTGVVDWDQLTELYAQVGLVGGYGAKGDGSKIRQAFENSSLVVTAWEGDRLVAAGRMLTDGLCYGSIFDVGVLLPFQKQGIGRGIMAALLEGNEHLYVHLTSTFGNEPFYAKLGFKRHKTAHAKYPHASDYLME